MAFRNNYNVMHELADKVVAPIRNVQSRIASYVPFSIAELLMALVLAFVLWCLIRRKWKKLITSVITIALFVWAGFSLMWGTYYYGDASLTAEPISVEQLTAVTQYFADVANENYCDEPDRSEILKKSAQMNDGIGAKGIICSKIMSWLDFSGFFFPITGEANVNMDMPAHDLASTCAHEIAHLNGVSREQDANFYAVKNSLEFGDRDYVYSAALMAYTYLGNALASDDSEAWSNIYNSLSEEVKNDLAETNVYWEQFKGPVKTASNTVYESFLYSYGQTMGLKSYGGCVDLLVNYYYPEVAK